MTAPQLNAVIQGVGAVNADNLNTYEQTCDNFAQLRAFVGLPGIQVFARGQTTINDGSGGVFYWNQTATGPDDNFNTIVPPSSAEGAWIRISIPQQTPTSLYDLAIFIEGVPSNGEVFPIFNVVRSQHIPIGMTASKFSIATLPTATTTFTFEKNGASIGTVAFSTLGVPTVTFTSQVSFVAGDKFSVVNQATADATAANIAMTIVFTVP